MDTNTAKETDMETKEIVTLREALTRVGLAGLVANDYQAEYLVFWTGVPQMFGCGHDSVKGFGPTHKEMDLGDTDERIYQKRARVCQSYCSGQVLFGWQRHAKFHKGEGTYPIASCAYVVLDVPPGESEPVLVLAISG
jgi:hypothetical protein